MSFNGQNVSETVRASAILTNAYVTGTAVTALYANQAVFNIGISLGSLTSVRAQVLHSNDGSTWFGEAFQDNANGSASVGEWLTPTYQNVHQFTTDGRYQIAAPVKSRYITMKVIGVGTVTNSSCSIFANVGVV